LDINWSGIYLILFLILLNAFFAASEIAVITSKRVKIKQLDEEGNSSAATLIKLIDDPSLFLSTIQVGITLAGFLASATAAVGLSVILEKWIETIGVPKGISSTLGVFTVTLVIAYLTLIFGELAPKRLAMQWSEKIALKVARPIFFLAKATSPLTKFLTFSTNLVVRFFGGNVQLKEKELSEDLHIPQGYLIFDVPEYPSFDEMKTLVSVNGGRVKLGEISTIVSALKDARFNHADLCIYVPKEYSSKVSGVPFEEYIKIPD